MADSDSQHSQARTPLIVRMLREMVRVRRIDERMLALQRQGAIAFYGPATGQEAVPVGVGLALEPQDWVFPALRESAVMLLRGFDLRTWMAQCFGNSIDKLRGRQMPSHMSSRQVHQVSWSTCVATQLPQAVGAAWAHRLQGRSAVSIGFVGDGATSHSDFASALNFAVLFRTPCVLICQNNSWAISTPVSRQTASASFADKAQALGMRSRRLDGNDVEAVHSETRQALEAARRGEGPTFLECVTYRIGPHSSSDDPSCYRSADEVEYWRTRDPIDRLAKRLAYSHQELETVMREIDQEFDTALKHVQEAGPVDTDSLFEDVYEVVPWHLREQQAEVRARRRS